MIFMRIVYIARITLFKTWGESVSWNFFFFGLQGVIWLIVRLYDVRISIKINCICCFNKMTSVTTNRPNNIHMSYTHEIHVLIMLWRKHRISDHFLNSHQVSSYRHRLCEQVQNVFYEAEHCVHTQFPVGRHSDNTFAVLVYNEAEAYFCLC